MPLAPVNTAAANRRPLVGVMCCNELLGRPVHTVASRFVLPLCEVSGAAVVLVPALPDAVDLALMSTVLDGLLLTGSRSHVAPDRYGAAALLALEARDQGRDAVALGLAGRMIEAGKPVFGICRGMQEINVLFGGTLSGNVCDDRHRRGVRDAYDELLAHRHPVELAQGGRLASAAGAARINVNSAPMRAVRCVAGVGPSLIGRSRPVSPGR